MTKLYYRPSKEEDCYILAPNLRHQDQLEISYSVGLSNDEVLVNSFNLSKTECNSIIYNDTVIGMFGLGIDPVNKTHGIPWLLGSDDLLQVKRPFLKQSKIWVDKISKDYTILYNYVHVGNKVSIKWLKYLGFIFIRLIPYYGVGRKPFYEFVKLCVLH